MMRHGKHMTDVERLWCDGQLSFEQNINGRIELIWQPYVPRVSFVMCTRSNGIVHILWNLFYFHLDTFTNIE